MPGVKKGQLKFLTSIATMSEKNKERMDEFTETAGNSDLAMSKLYSKESNAKKYRQALEIAKRGKSGEKLYLREIKGRKNLADYKIQPPNWKTKLGKLDKDI